MICAGKIGYTSTMSLNIIHFLFSEGLADGSKDTCLYDAGGPLVTKAAGSNSGYSLIGVVSFGDGCGQPNRIKYGVSTEFSNYIDWVAEESGLTGTSSSSQPRKEKIHQRKIKNSKVKKRNSRKNKRKSNKKKRFRQDRSE